MNSEKKIVRPARRAIRFLIRQSIRLLTALLLVALCLLAWLYLVGLPESGRLRLLQHLQETNFPIVFEHIELDFPLNVRLDRVRWTFGESDPLQPFGLQAERVSIRIHPLHTLLKKTTAQTITLHAARVRLPDDAPPAIQQTVQDLRVNEAELTLTGKTIYFRRLSLDAAGCRFVGSGTAVLPEPKEPPPAPFTAEALHQRLAQIEQRLQPLMEQAARIRFETPPRATLYFEIDLNRPQNLRLTTGVQSGPFHADAIPFEVLNMVIKMESGTLQMQNLDLRHAGGSLTGSGVWVVAGGGLAEIKAHSTLPWNVWLAFLPEPALRWVNENQVSLADELSLELTTGPVPVAEWFNHFELRGRIGRLCADQLIAENLTVQADKSGPLVSFSGLNARLSKPGGPEERSGPVSGEGRINLKNQSFHADLQLNFDPLWICPWLPPEVREEIEHFTFHGPAPHLSLELTGGWTAEQSTVSVSGRIEATQLSYRDVPLIHMEGRLAAGKGFLDINDLKIARPEGKATARISADFDADTVHFEVQSTLNPAALAQLIDDHLVQGLSLFEFQGTAEISASGLYDYGPGTQTDLEGTFVCRNTLLPEVLLFDLLSGTVIMQGNRLVFQPLKAQLHEGLAEGRLEFDFSRSETVPALLQLNLHRIDFDRWYAFRHPDLTISQEMGFFHGSAWLEFDAARTDWEHTLSGTGWARIQEGLLVDLPLIGRFSQLVRWMDPQFNLLSQNNFSMGFDLQDGILYTGDAQLDGTLLSLSGSGEYDLPTDRLDFRVQMRPFRDTVRLTRLAQTLSAPASRLLSFRLTGPLEDPQWSFTNLSPTAVADALRRLGDSLTPSFLTPTGK